MLEFLLNPLMAWFGIPSITACLLIIIILILIFKD